MPYLTNSFFFAEQRLNFHYLFKHVDVHFVSQVPELARLQDHSKTARVRHYKHRVDLMYRASRNNEDRTNILIHNNPPPEVASLDTDQDGVGRYLPSWMDDRVSDQKKKTRVISLDSPH